MAAPAGNLGVRAVERETRLGVVIEIHPVPIVRRVAALTAGILHAVVSHQRIGKLTVMNVRVANPAFTSDGGEDVADGGGGIGAVVARTARDFCMLPFEAISGLLMLELD